MDTFTAELLVGGNAWDAPVGSGKSADLKNPSGVAVDSLGNVFVADTENNRVLKRMPDGAVSVLADEIETPGSLALAPNGDLWVHVLWDLWKISPAGARTKVLGWKVENANSGQTDDEPGDDDLIRTVSAIAVDAAGTLYFTDAGRNQVCKLNPDGEVVVVAGSGQAGYADGPADQAKFRTPRGIAVAPDGTIYVSDTSPRIRKVTPAGQVERVAGTYEGQQDGPADEAMFERPGALALGPDGTLYVSGATGTSTRAISPDGNVTTLTATYMRGKKKQVDRVGSDAIAFDKDGTIYVACRYDQAVWRLSPRPAKKAGPSGRRKAGSEPHQAEPVEVLVTTLAGGWDPGQDDGQPERARFNGPTGILATAEGIFVADTSNHRLRLVSDAGVVSTVAGTMRGEADGEAGAASFFEPMGLARNGRGVLVIADTSNDRIRCITEAGQVATMAGQQNWSSLIFHMDEGTTGVVRPDGDEILQPMGESLDWIDYRDGTATESKFNNPIGLLVDANGNILIADNRNGRIRRLDPEGMVTTLTLNRSSRGLRNRWTGEPIRAGMLAQPVGLALGPGGDLYVTEAGLARVNRITPDGQVHLVAGGTHGFADGPAQSAAFDKPAGLLVDTEGTVFVADSGNHRIRRITTDGQVDTIAGGEPGYVDGMGSTARFNEPWGLAFDREGHLLVTDRRNNVIRRISFAPADPPTSSVSAPVKPSDIVAIFAHAPDHTVRRKAAPLTPRLTGWDACVGRRIRIITKGSPYPTICIYFDDAWVEIEGVGDDPMPYFKDALFEMDFHLDPSHLVGKTIVRLDVSYADPGGDCEYIGFTFDDGLRQWLEPHYGSGFRIS